MPIATPAAPYASAATRPRPSKKPPAAITGMSTASTTCGSSSVVGTGAGVAAALAALHDHRVDAPARDLLGVAARADRRHRPRRPRPSASSSAARRGAWAKLATFTPSRTSSAMRSSTSGWSERRFTPNGLSVRLLTSWIALRQLVVGHRALTRGCRGRPPRSSPTSAAVPATQPMPVCTIGSVDAEQRRRSPRVCRRRRSASRIRDFLLAAGRAGR